MRSNHSPMQEQYLLHTLTKIMTLTTRVASQIKIVIKATIEVKCRCSCNLLEITVLARYKQHDIAADKPQLFPTFLLAPKKERVLA